MRSIMVNVTSVFVAVLNFMSLVNLHYCIPTTVKSSLL